MQSDYLGSAKPIDSTIKPKDVTLASLPKNPAFHGSDVKGFRERFKLTQKDMKKVLSFSNTNGYIPIVNGKPTLVKLSSWNVKTNIGKTLTNSLIPLDSPGSSYLLKNKKTK